MLGKGQGNELLPANLIRVEKTEQIIEGRERSVPLIPSAKQHEILMPRNVCSGPCVSCPSGAHFPQSQALSFLIGSTTVLSTPGTVRDAACGRWC